MGKVIIRGSRRKGIEIRYSECELRNPAEEMGLVGWEEFSKEENKRNLVSDVELHVDGEIIRGIGYHEGFEYVKTFRNVEGKTYNFAPDQVELKKLLEERNLSNSKHIWLYGCESSTGSFERSFYVCLPGVYSSSDFLNGDGRILWAEEMAV